MENGFYHSIFCDRETNNPFHDDMTCPNTIHYDGFLKPQIEIIGAEIGVIYEMNLSLGWDYERFIGEVVEIWDEK